VKIIMEEAGAIEKRAHYKYRILEIDG